MKLLRTEPALLAALVVAVMQALAVDEAWQKVALAALALAAGGAVRAVVTPVAKLTATPGPQTMTEG